MKVEAFLSHFEPMQDVTFIIAEAVQAAEGYVYFSYKTAPIWQASEFIGGDFASRYVVIDASHPPLDVSGIWHKWFRSGRLKCAVVATPEDLAVRYGSEWEQYVFKGEVV